MINDLPSTIPSSASRTINRTIYELCSRRLWPLIQILRRWRYLLALTRRIVHLTLRMVLRQIGSLRYSGRCMPWRWWRGLTRSLSVDALSIRIWWRTRSQEGIRGRHVNLLINAIMWRGWRRNGLRRGLIATTTTAWGNGHVLRAQLMWCVINLVPLLHRLLHFILLLCCSLLLLLQSLVIVS